MSQPLSVLYNEMFAHNQDYFNETFLFHLLWRFITIKGWATPFHLYTNVKWCLINLDKMFRSRKIIGHLYIIKKRHIDFTLLAMTRVIHNIEHHHHDASVDGRQGKIERRAWERANLMHYSAILCCAKSRVWRVINAITSHNQNLMNCYGTISNCSPFKWTHFMIKIKFPSIETLSIRFGFCGQRKKHFKEGF